MGSAGHDLPRSRFNRKGSCKPGEGGRLAAAHDEERLPGTSFISSEQRNALKDGLEVREAASNVSESSS